MTRRNDRWFAWSAAGQVTTGAAGLLTNVAYTQALSLHEIADVAVANALAILLVVALDRGVGPWLTRNLPTRHLGPRVALTFAVTSGAPALAAALCGALAFAAFTGFDGFAIVVLLALPLALSLWLFQIALVLAQTYISPRARASAVAGNGLLTLGSAAAAMSLAPSVFAAIATSFAAYLGVSALVIYKSRAEWSAARLCEPSPERAPAPPFDARVALREARPLFGANIATFLVSAGDVLLAAAVLSPTSVAQYQIAKKVAQAGTLPFSSAAPVLLGRLSSMTSSEGRRSTLRFATGFTLTALVGVVVIAPVLPIALETAFGSEYRTSANITIIIGCALSLQVLRDLLGALRTAEGDYRAPLIANFAVAGALVIGVLTLHPWISLTGLSYCLFAAMLSGLAVHVFRLSRTADWRTTHSLRIGGMIGLLCIAVALGSLATSLTS